MSDMQEVVNKICGGIPPGFILSLNMENGSAWVELIRLSDGDVELPDSADLTLEDQLDDGLSAAIGLDKVTKGI